MDRETRYREGMIASWVGIIANIALMVFKFTAGIIGQSQALVADAVESFSDVVSTSVVLISLKISSKPVDWDHPYGHGRAETLATGFMALAISTAGILIIWRTINEMIAGVSTVPRPLALAAAVIVIIVKEFLYRYFAAKGRALNSAVLLASATDQRKDSITSIAALLGIAGALLGVPILDPLAALVVSVFILKFAYDIAVKTGGELMDRVPDVGVIGQIRSIALGIAGVERAEVRARRLGPNVFVEIKIAVDPSISVREGHDIAKQVKTDVIDRIEEVEDVMVHINPLHD